MASDAEQIGFYTSLAERLSQGDIVKNVPWGVIEAPLTFCRPSSKAGQAFFAPVTEAKRTTPFAAGPETIHAVGQAPSLGCVIWEDCQIDKMMSQGQAETRWYVSVAPVRPLSSLPNEDARVAIREGRRMAFFPLPASPEIPESFVDLRLMWPVRQALLTERVASISPTARASLYGHLFTFLTARRVVLPSLCPSCGKALDATSALRDVREG
jgi:hypothetical protein